MKREILVLATLLLLLAAPLQALANVELTLRNEEQSDARVALAYKQGDRYLVEGWFWLKPNEGKLIALHGVDDGDIFILVEFQGDSSTGSDIKQFVADGALEVTLLVQAADFRYALWELGEAWEPAFPVMRGGTFQNIPEFYRTEKGKLWFNLGAAAG